LAFATLKGALEWDPLTSAIYLWLPRGIVPAQLTQRPSS
jgi:hypothetical protein